MQKHVTMCTDQICCSERQYRICGYLAVEFNGVIGLIGVGQMKVDVCSRWS